MSSSSRRRSSPGEKPNRPVSSVFKPKFPFDPFVAADVREPWFIRADSLPSPHAHPRRDVLLVLGSPSTKDLDALLSSKHLANSLLVIVTHQPPEIPHTALPTVRILKLNNSLELEHAGAVRFVNILEWAERVARLWRKYGGYGAAELTEDSDGREHLPPPKFWRFRGSQSVPPSPRSSASNLSTSRGSVSSGFLAPDGDQRPQSRPHSFSSRILNRARQVSLPAVDPSQRPFDALINFLPKDVPDKALLKQAILVTTISRPFLIATSFGAARPVRKPRLNSRSSTSLYLPPTPPYHSGESLPSLMLTPTRSHLIHVLPVETRSFNSFARSKLVQSLESFLLSFAYPTKYDMKGTSDDYERPRPYIMTSTGLGENVDAGSVASSPSSPYDSWGSDCTLVELVLCGCLDGDDPSPALRDLKGKAPADLKMLAHAIPRALLSCASDVVVLPEDAPMHPAVTLSQSDPGYYSGGTSPAFPSSLSSPAHLQFARHSSSPVVLSSHSKLTSSPISSSTKPACPTSPLAKEEQHIDKSLPTPPDSEDSGTESGPGVVFKPKKQRWKFWKRPVRVTS
ncbi:hypothetical protein BDY19DRAFT_955435 [Irpex rosettiformis]|uniref:Uncharacterized protein n=1 Tax=Irpex rosettiformis TaxID=378272 RepID=A0ACB8TZD7_9APHY|nr:hypothetical protein BDY19DRAFT_955435 [Irpex rosettiformis]